MCRLFGFRSVIRSQVHRSLVSAENALSVQSNFHSDGWGVAYYIEDHPHLIRSSNAAFQDQIFHRVSGVVSSETVVAHIRKATQGIKNTLNCHPFQYGRWIFAHNGNVFGFKEHREAFIGLCSPGLKRFILGDTDSEVLFYLFLTHLDRIVGGKSLQSPDIPLASVAMAMRDMIDEVSGIVGPFCRDSTQPGKDNTFMSFIVTNGKVLLAHQGGQKLYYSTWKKRCSERDSCPSFGTVCEAETTSGFVNHFIVSSEVLQGENVWKEVEVGMMVGVDDRMRLCFWREDDLRAEKIQVQSPWASPRVRRVDTADWILHLPPSHPVRRNFEEEKKMVSSPLSGTSIQAVQAVIEYEGRGCDSPSPVDESLISQFAKCGNEDLTW